MEFYWEGIKYQLFIRDDNGHVEPIYYDTEEQLAEGIKLFGDKVISFNKVINGIIVED